MKKLLNTLFVTSEDAYLTLDGENVVVNREKQVTARFPLHALAGIISFSYAGASPALMGACAKRAGAWIEMRVRCDFPKIHWVAPFTGAWIEILLRSSLPTGVPSLPSRERGLKSLAEIEENENNSVAPFAGAWIEIRTFLGGEDAT